jgi:hypothetical protein
LRSFPGFNAVVSQNVRFRVEVRKTIREAVCPSIRLAVKTPVFPGDFGLSAMGGDPSGVIVSPEKQRA